MMPTARIKTCALAACLLAACLLLPLKMGLDGVWVAIPCSQVLSGVIAFVIKQNTDR